MLCLQVHNNKNGLILFNLFGRKILKMKKLIALLKMITLLIVAYSVSGQYSSAQESSPARIAAPLSQLIKQFKQDKNAEAEVILRKTDITIDEQYLSHTTSYVAVHINSDEAVRDYSQISISFNSFYEDIALEFANVRTPEGQLDSIKADATQIQSPTDENFYHDRKELLFSLPNVRKGSVIEFQYRYTDTKKIIANQWFDSINLHWWEDRAANQGSRADPVAIAELNLTAPKTMTFFSNDVKKMGVSYTRNQKGNQQILNWKAKNLPNIILQDNMPRDHVASAHLRISTTDSWQKIADWANQLITPHLVTDAKLDAVINTIAKTAVTPEEKVKAVYQTLQEKVRYVFAHVGRGGYEPHNTTEVLSNGYGDCKDQSALAVIMLRKLGLQADAALLITRSRGIPDMSITNVSFDHMIVHMPKQTGLQEMWIDTSGDASLYPGFSSGLEGQPALIVRKDTQQIVTIPSRTAEQHFAHFELVFDTFEGRNTEAAFTLKLGGSFEQRLRGMWQYSRERDKSFRDMLDNIFPSADVGSLKGNNADSLWQSFSVDGRFLFKNVWNGNKDKLVYGFNISQLMGLFSGLRELDTPKNRVHEYEIDPGYTLSTHLVLTRPSAAHIAQLNTQGQNFDNNYFSLSQTGREENGNFVIDQTLVVKPLRISAQEYAQFYDLVQQLLDSSSWTVNYAYDATAEELASLTQTALSDKKASSFIAITRLHLKNGAYAKALDAATQAVKKDSKNGEAYYYLGLAQGYSNLLHESDKSFEKAEALGFEL
jgi:Domain of Unknown Function with PDB structure (DUF3857)/Transglutaminase-like superfamily